MQPVMSTWNLVVATKTGTPFHQRAGDLHGHFASSSGVVRSIVLFVALRS